MTDGRQVLTPFPGPRSRAPAETAAEHYAQAKADAWLAALQRLSALATDAELAKQEAEALGSLLPPSVADGLPRLADHMNIEIERMTLALKNGGMIR